MANTTSERITKSNADDIAKGAQTAEKIMKDTREHDHGRRSRHGRQSRHRL
jgi:hypothetical protein